LLDTATDPVPTHSFYDDALHRVGALRYRVLEPLIEFGVLESRPLPSADKWNRPIEVRKTPLFDRLLRFDFGSAQN
jgi:hypothetical protein